MHADLDTVANKQLMERFFAVFSTGNVEAIGALMHDQCSWWVAGNIEGISGTHSKAQMLVLLEQVTTVYKRGALQLTPSSMIAEGSRVAVEAESYAELHNGKVYNNHCHFVFEIEDGRIRLIKEYLDTCHVEVTFLTSA
jgi:ketosteroid isomerase-like protein